MQYETKYRPDMPKKEITNVLYDVLTVYINIDRFYGNVWQQIAKMNNLPGTLPAGKGYHAKEETFGAWIRRLIKSPINYDKYDCHYVTFPRKEEDLKLVQTGTYEKIKDPSLGAKLHSRMDTLQTESIWEIMDIYIPSEDGKTEHAFTTSDMVELLAEYCFTHPKAMEALIPKMIEISNRKYRNLHAAQDFQKTKENRNPQNLEEINELLAKEDYEQFWFFLKEAVPSEGHDISLLAFPNRVNIDSRRHILCITTE